MVVLVIANEFSSRRGYPPPHSELRLRATSPEALLDAVVSELNFQLACHARTTLYVHTRYRPDAKWTPQPLDRAAALFALMDNTVRAREKPEFMLDILTHVAERADALGGDRGDASTLIETLL